MWRFLMLHRAGNQQWPLTVSLVPYSLAIVPLPKSKCMQSSVYIVSWEPVGHYQYSEMFFLEPEGGYRCTKSVVIVPFWFSTEHLWIVIAPFWLSTDDIRATKTIAHTMYVQRHSALFNSVTCNMSPLWKLPLSLLPEIRDLILFSAYCWNIQYRLWIIEF